MHADESNPPDNGAAPPAVRGIEASMKEERKARTVKSEGEFQVERAGDTDQDTDQDTDPRPRSPDDLVKIRAPRQFQHGKADLN
jgi:hypothetical protein